MDLVLVYFGRTYTVTARGMAWREQTCEQCGGTFHYPAVFEAAGVAESPYFLNNAGARAKAERRAAEAVARAAATTTVAVPCRHCGWFQRAMIPPFRAMLWPDLGRIGTMLAGAGLMLGMIAAIIWVGEADPATPAVEGARLIGTCFLFAAPGWPSAGGSNRRSTRTATSAGPPACEWPR